MMKKFLFFISLLFFIMIPRASATAPENPYLLYDFRSENSLTPYLSSTIEYLTTTECPFSSCNGTYYENLNNLVNGLTSSGYNFFIILARSSTSVGSNVFDFKYNRVDAMIKNSLAISKFNSSISFK